DAGLRGRRRPPPLEPAVLDGLLLAERTDVDEVDAVRREPDRALTHEQRAFADRARPGCGRAGDSLHGASSVAPSPGSLSPANVLRYMSHTYVIRGDAADRPC